MEIKKIISEVFDMANLQKNIQSFKEVNIQQTQLLANMESQVKDLEQETIAKEKQRQQIAAAQQKATANVAKTSKVDTASARQGVGTVY